MNINIFNYLQNFENMNLPNEHGIIIEDGKRIKHLSDIFCTYNQISYYDVDEEYNIFTKKFVDSFREVPSDRYFSELLASRIYEKSGINCVRTFPFVNCEDMIGGHDYISVGSEDLKGIKSLDMTDDNEFLMNLSEELLKNDNTVSSRDMFENEWLILTNPKLKNEVLTHMTPECFDDLIDLMIMDVLFYNSDRFGYPRNLFFAKNPSSEKIETVVAFDLESINFDALDLYFNGSVNKYVKEMYTDPTFTVAAHGANLSMTYKNRVETLKEIARRGYFNDRQLKLINDVLSLNITEEINDILNKYNLDLNKKVKKIYGELWKRNGDILSL